MAQNPPLRAAVLCHNRLAMPAVQYLQACGLLCALGTATDEKETLDVFQNLALRTQIPFTRFSKKEFGSQLADWLHANSPDVVYVMVFPFRIPASALQVPKWGFVNFHYGLLPEMRGADPIFESIRRRKDAIGTTVHVIDQGLDTGPILYRDQMPLPPELTYGMASTQMAMMGERLCRMLTEELSTSGMPPATPQDEAAARYYGKVGEADITISWGQMEVPEIIALARSCNPIAKGAPTSINGWKIAVCDASEVNLQGDASAIAPGTVLAADPQNGLIVCCKGGTAVKLEAVYSAEGILPGYKLAFFGIQPGMMFS